MSNGKYEFTGETKKCYGVVLRRIRAKKTFGDVKAGDIGGWIEDERNLSADGNAWVYGSAVVYGSALVSGNARVSGDAEVSGDARVHDNALVGDFARVSGFAKVYGYAVVRDNALVSGNARLDTAADVCGDAVVGDVADCMVFKNYWSSMRWFTYIKSNKKWKVGCFCGTGEELVKKAYADSETSGRCYEAIVRAVEVIEKTLDDKARKGER